MLFIVCYSAFWNLKLNYCGAQFLQVLLQVVIVDKQEYSLSYSSFFVCIKIKHVE